MNKVNISQYEYLVESNQRLVYKIARKFKVTPFEYDDLVQAGMMGLFNAAKKYDITKGVKFSTFATYFIIGSIKDELAKNNFFKISKYYRMNNNNNLDEIDKIVMKEYREVVLKEDLNEVEGKYLNIDLYDFDQIEKKILKLRLENRFSQAKIGEELQISQSKVSRILKKMKEKIEMLK